MFRRRKRRPYWIFLVLLFFGISVGYAFLAADLDINGSTNVVATSWDIHFDNLVVTENTVGVVNTPAAISSDQTSVSFSVGLQMPGDTYEFTFDAINSGSIDGMVNTVTTALFASDGVTAVSVPNYLEYEITYDVGTPILQYHLLEAGNILTYKVRIHFKEDISEADLLDDSVEYIFTVGVNYVQANSNGIRPPEPQLFGKEDWATIVTRVKSGDTSKYAVGDLKQIDLGSLGVHTVRIANMSKPDRCANSNYSETACGFVLEFADVITTYRMNYSYDEDDEDGGNVGSWPDTLMRTYINNTIYNALPQALKDGIIQTRVLTGHGDYDSGTFTSTDKLYLLSAMELYGYWSRIGDYEYPYDFTAQLDYYKSRGVNSTNYGAVIKKSDGTASIWWLRSPEYEEYEYFLAVQVSGTFNTYKSTNYYGVSPAFRIGASPQS